MNPIRNAAIKALYHVANLLCLAADLITPKTDEVWRKEQWKRWDSQHPNDPPPKGFDHYTGMRADDIHDYISGDDR